MSFTQSILYTEILQQGTVLEGLIKSSEGTISKIVDNLNAKDIKQIVVVARGSSGYACDYFAYLTEIFTKYSVKVVSPSTITVYDGKIALDNSLVIGVSQSGMAQDVLACLERAKQNGSITVAITNNLVSPIAKLVDHHLYCDVGPELSVAATKSYTASIYLLMLLVKAISKDPAFDDAPKNIVKGIKQVLKDAREISAYAIEHFKDTKDLFVITRGINFAIAKETALKFNETCYIKAFAYSAAEFQHGPYAMVDNNATIIAYASSGKNQNDTLKIATRAKLDGAKVTLISDTKSIQISETETITPDIIIPKGTEIETPFYNIVVAQILANATADNRGIEVDRPRGLKKVTITK